jgi:cytochrome c oxidase subunit 2
MVAAQQGCLRCHTLDGTPHIGPTWAGLYGARVPLADGTAVIAEEAYLTESMMNPMTQIHAGFAAVMPSYLGLLRPAETAAIVELIKSLRAAPPPAGVGPPPQGTIESRSPSGAPGAPVHRVPPGPSSSSPAGTAPAPTPAAPERR